MPASVSPKIRAQERLIVALDLPSIEEARSLVAKLDGVASFYKVGLSLQLAEGVGPFIDELLTQGKRVFLDYKYLDVEETMRKAVARAASLGVTFLTVHGSGGIVRAAVEGRGEAGLKLLSVTVLTSLDAQDIRELGFECSVEELVLYRARKSLEAGCDGVIASGWEAQKVRQIAADRPFLVVTPGIRPRSKTRDEQKRAMEPGVAIRSGADYLVVGRPVYGDPDPRASAERILEEMQPAFDERAAGVKSPIYAST
jgi:orotidine-5'-phosphate decarboxylase